MSGLEKNIQKCFVFGDKDPSYFSMQQMFPWLQLDFDKHNILN
jgi:hypothetical protein